MARIELCSAAWIFRKTEWRESSTFSAVLMGTTILAILAFVLCSPSLAEGERDKVFDGLLRQIKSSEYQARARAAQVLGRCNDKRAVEPLILALKDDSADVRENAIEALGRLQDKRAIEPIIEALRNETGDVREKSIQALGQLRDKRATEPLIAAMYREDSRGVGYIVQALEQIGDERAVEFLLRILKDEKWAANPFARRDSWARTSIFSCLAELGDLRAAAVLVHEAAYHDHIIVRRAALEALVRLGPGVVPSVLKVLDNQNLQAKEELVALLAKIGDSRAVEPLLALLEETTDTDNDIVLKNAVIFALGELGDNRAFIPLLERIDDPGWDVGCAAVIALGKLGDPRAVEPLCAVVRKFGPSVIGNHAANALVELGDKRAIPALEEACNSYNPQTVNEMVPALLKLGGKPPVRVILSKVERTGWSHSRDNTAEDLSMIGPSAIQPLIEGLRHEHSQAREVSAKALGMLGASESFEPLLKLLHDNNEGVRRAAAFALGHLGNSKAVEPLLPLLADEHSWVRNQTLTSLGQLKDERSFDAITKWIEEHPEDKWGLEFAISALGQLGDKRAVDILIPYLSHQEHSLRCKAVEALSQVPDQRSVPALMEMIDSPGQARGTSCYSCKRS